MKRLVLLLAVLTACATGASAGDDTETPRKVFVCKYVGTPGVDERLQTGQNPISVSVNAIPDPPGPNVQVGDEFADAQGRSLVIAFDVGQPEPDVSDCPQPPTPTTTTHATTTTAKATTTTQPNQTTTTAGPTTTVVINTVVITGPSTTGAPTSTTPPTSTTSSSLPPTSSTSPAPLSPSTTTSTPPSPSSTTPPPSPFVPFQPTTPPPPTTAPPTPTPPLTAPPTPFAFGAATTVCVSEVPTIRINFQNTFPELAGRTGTLTMADAAGNVVSTQALVYRPNTTVDLLYPGTSVNPDGSIDDVPGWILTDDGLWIRDPSDAFLREGIQMTYTVNPTATAFVTYPPESSTCANPDGPFTPGLPPTR
jgi:hypothetical protein